MKNTLIIIDVQNDFCNKGGSLCNENTISVVQNIKKLLFDHDKHFDHVICTMDTHGYDYLKTKEGQNLPVKHCLKDSWGWKIEESLYKSLYYVNGLKYLEKRTFSPTQDELRQAMGVQHLDDNIFICGVCTDICVINTALMVKNTFDANVHVIENCCAATNPENHYAAIRCMEASHIHIVRGELLLEAMQCPNYYLKNRETSK